MFYNEKFPLSLARVLKKSGKGHSVCLRSRSGFLRGFNGILRSLFRFRKPVDILTSLFRNLRTSSFSIVTSLNQLSKSIFNASVSVVLSAKKLVCSCLLNELVIDSSHHLTKRSIHTFLSALSTASVNCCWYLFNSVLLSHVPRVS